jgi:hypothetical protein
MVAGVAVGKLPPNAVQASVANTKTSDAAKKKTRFVRRQVVMHDSPQD